MPSVATKAAAQKPKPASAHKPKPKSKPLVKADAGRTIPPAGSGARAYQRDVTYYNVTPKGSATHGKHVLTLSEKFVGPPAKDKICQPCTEQDPAYINNGEFVDAQIVMAGASDTVERRWSVDGQPASVLNDNNDPFDFELLHSSVETNPPFQVEYGNDPH